MPLSRRRSRHSMRSGVLMIDKPAGLSSAAVVARVKRALGAQRVGHAGTLDPDATGLLVCLLNGATRVASYALEGRKVYSGTMRLGVRTSTDDMAGTVLEECHDLPTFEYVQEAARGFLGISDQVPPKVSAVKVGGQRAYKLQRAGKDVDLRGRAVTVDQFEVTAISPRSIGYRIVCSPGTYVRALARDLGEKLGCGGAAETIRREGSGHLSVKNAVALDQISWDAVVDWSMLIPHVPRIVLPAHVAMDLLRGRTAALSAVDPFIGSLPGEHTLVAYAAEDDRGETLGLLSVDATRRVAFELNIARQREG